MTAGNITTALRFIKGAKKKNGDWIIMELGDGQVAGLPDNADRSDFYKTLKDNMLQQFIY
ncbi:hypothetical protein [Kordia zhangzhouensis]|uniref:hypothetical protein n=1 Tax=Kordia zhangzhouensis TaxID=1620405 RepID=UPI0006296E0C|nr:hypothetical protein [Kordia zhangzhouensis]